MATRKRKRRGAARVAKTARMQETRTEEEGRHTPFNLRNEEIEGFLLTGENAGILEDYFGTEGYREVRQLALKASGRRAAGPRVLILPGIMGTKLGRKRPFPLPDDLIWFDPLDIATGNIADLALDSGKRCEPLGVMLLFYLKLKLRLEIAGFNADLFPFDWRQGLDRLGADLAAFIQKERAEKIHIVAHSMGGLVTRAAVDKVSKRVGRVVMLGTPNFGSFAPVQCIRGVYPVIKKLAFLDLGHSAEEIAGKVLSTFPGLYQMLPSREKFSALDLFDGAVWPKEGPQPAQSLLREVPAVQEKLASGREGFYLIAGVDKETVTGLTGGEEEFEYELSRQGDGTVPLALAELQGAKTYYVRESHGSLPNNRTVAEAVTDILATGRTTALPDSWAPPRVTPWTVSDRKLKMTPVYEGRRGRRLSQGEMRHVLDEFLSPEAKEAEGVAGAEARAAREEGEMEPSFQGVVVGRRRQQRIEIRIAFGDIREADAEALVLGVFRNVAPTGPARALDERLGGAISELTGRRMFSGNVGEVFMMPTSRHNLRADTILFVGLGSFDACGGEVLQIAAENIVRTIVRSRIDEFATVLLGAGSGEGISSALYNLLVGLIRGLKDADKDRRMRRITLCEFDRDRFDAIRRELLRLSSTTLFEDVEVTFDEVVLPAAPEAISPVLRAPRGPDPVYLIVRREVGEAGIHRFRSSVLGAGKKATVLTGVKDVARGDLEALLKEIESDTFTLKRLGEYGTRLGEMVLSPEIRVVLASMKERHIVVVHDAESSRILWETIALGGWFPGKEAGISRRYVADNLSVAKWLEERRQDEVLNVLLVVNPTGDLAGALEEGGRVKAIFSNNPAVKIDELREEGATKGALLRAFRSGAYDVIHYAGHAFFDVNDPAGSGVLCSGKQILSGRELAGIGNLPALVFFNACEAARVRKGPDLKRKSLDVARRIERNVGLAEAFLRGGIANYVGTYWPVGDASAKSFAETFYTNLMKGIAIGDALQAGRKAIAGKSVDWADYVHYGDFTFMLKEV